MIECRYCGVDCGNAITSDEVAIIDHYLFECDEIPEEVREWYNMPPVERRKTEPPEEISDNE